MTIMRHAALTFACFVAALACHRASEEGGDGRNAAQRQHARKTDIAAKRGALRAADDPRQDLAKQEANLQRLARNAALNRAAGNRVGAWAAEWDLRRTRKQIEQDRAKIAAEGAR